MNNKGSLSMTTMTLFFIVGVLSLIGAVFLYSNQENTAYHKTLEMYNALKADYNGLKTSCEALSKSNADLTTKIGALTVQHAAEVSSMQAKLNEVSSDCEQAQTHCAKLRSSMIQLQDQVSRRRPVMKLSGPIQLEILSNSKSNPRSPHQSPAKSAKQKIMEVEADQRREAKIKEMSPEARKKLLEKVKKQLEGLEK